MSAATNVRLLVTLGLAGTFAPGTGAASPADTQSLTWDEPRVHFVVRDRVERATRTRIAVEQPSTADDPCRDRGWDDDRYTFCEVRDHAMPAGPLTVDAGPNGGIRVEASDRGDILVRAIVTAQAPGEEAAEQIASGIEVQASGGRVAATGPSTGPREGWSVGYRISVPRHTDLDLSATNGGIAIADVSGTVRFRTSNGGVRLAGVGGDVRGETRNGGVSVTLTGDRWEGTGLDVETANGGVTVSIPEGYNAELDARTVNGGVRVEVPVTVQGELAPRRGIVTTLGAGGAPLRMRTRNGALRIRRR
jgi:hypothetical protein